MASGLVYLTKFHTITFIFGASNSSHSSFLLLLARLTGPTGTAYPVLVDVRTRRRAHRERFCRTCRVAPCHPHDNHNNSC